MTQNIFVHLQKSIIAPFKARGFHDGKQRSQGIRIEVYSTFVEQLPHWKREKNLWKILAEGFNPDCVALSIHMKPIFKKYVLKYIAF